jgi:hypothetical protein
MQPTHAARLGWRTESVRRGPAKGIQNINPSCFRVIRHLVEEMKPLRGLYVGLSEADIDILIASKK